MDLTRRRLMAAVAAVAAAPLGLAAAAFTVRLGGAAAAAASALRPASQGTSATVCAACGSPDHAMLDGCPTAQPAGRSAIADLRGRRPGASSGRA